MTSGFIYRGGITTYKHLCKNCQYFTFPHLKTCDCVNFNVRQVSTKISFSSGCFWTWK